MQQCSVNPGGYSQGPTVNPRRYSQGNFAEPIASPAKKRPIFKQIPLAIFDPPFVHRDLDGFVDVVLELWLEHEENNIKIYFIKEYKKHILRSFKAHCL